MSTFDDAIAEGATWPNVDPESITVTWDSATTGLPHIGAEPRWYWKIPFVGRRIADRQNAKAAAAGDVTITWSAP